MKRATPLAWLILAGLLAGCSPSPAPALPNGDAASTRPAADTRRLHALIVGIDRYRFSDARQPGAVFSDLRGAVGDALRFKQALADVFGVDVDAPAAGACESSNAATTTLTDDCATRARILQALEERIATLRPGDTLLFYFAGHGSRYRDDEARDQDTGYNGTILPADARNPDGSPGDLFDVELKALKDRATARGLYFVSVFDACNSATATRDGAGGQSRSAPPFAGSAPPALTTSASGGDGYWVHLAAAQDGEEAQETGGVGTRAGVFTTALVDALRMPGMRDATFGDLIQEVRLRVAARGHATQTPSAEGALNAAFGARARTTVLFDVAQSDGTPVLQAGATSGMTRGSRFALYATQA
ncbi:MAG TPA: caspase family protein, partial [Thermomonas sp.]|nr:caspase family protein [Thermomonas sp.]